MKAADGIAQIALGFGKTVVEGEKCLVFSPRYPESLPQFANVDDMLASSQQTFYALPLKGHPEELDYLQSNLVKREISEAESEPPVQTLTSTYSPAEHCVRDSFGKGSKVVTFARILKHRMLPLAEILQDLLELGSKGMSCDIEIEFALDLGSPEEMSRFHFLQIRPMVAGDDQYEVSIERTEIDKAFCYSTKPLGHGVNDQIADIVFVKPETFNNKDTRVIGREINRINARLTKEQKPYLLVGPGRWGSADPLLGIPVKWEDISGVAAIVELRNDQISAEDSQGSHFFQNITAMGIKYMTVTENEVKCSDFINWHWLDVQPKTTETKHVKHVRLPKPFLIKVDSATSQSVMLEK
jgi:hypothetical protein